MRRDINWITKRDDGSRYDVRVTWFSGHFKFQYRERARIAGIMTASHRPKICPRFSTRSSALHTRKQATLKELEVAQRLAAASS